MTAGWLLVLAATFGAPLPKAPGPELRKGPRFELGVRVVIRPEARANSTLRADARDDTWRVLEGARISATGSWGPGKVVVQLQDVRSFGQGASTLSTDPLAGLHQGYLELSRTGRTSAALRLGRQELVLWSGRLIGNAPWQPANRAFDAVHAQFERDRVHMQVAALLISAPGTITTGEDDPAVGVPINVRSSGDQVYYLEAGIDAVPAFGIDAGVLARRAAATEAAPTQDRAYAGPGVQLRGRPTEGLDYELEAWVQAGRDQSRRSLAWMSAATVGYVSGASLRPGIRVTNEIASGSACTHAPASSAGCSARSSADFDQLLGTRHAFRGYADLMALQGGGDLAGRVSLQPHPDFSFSLDYHWLYLYARSGRWLDASGRPVGDGWSVLDRRRALAHEVDVLVSWHALSFLEVRPGYSVVVPTSAGISIAGPRALHFAYLWMIAQFG